MRIELEHRAESAYCPAMDDILHHSPRADWDPPMPSEAEVRASLDRSDADIAAGRTVPASIVHAELQAALDRMEAGRTQSRGAKAQR